MTFGGQALNHRRLRAPRENGAALVDPPFSSVEALVEENVRRRQTARYDFQGRRLDALVAQSRRELVDEARRYTSAYRDVAAAAGDPAGKIFLAGHQPELFHPGVWFKNFGLGTLGARHDATAINLLIDSDTVRTTACRVPSGSASEPAVESIDYDQPGPAIPHEERRILDGALFADFGRRAAAAIAPLVPEPLLREFWPLAVARARENPNLGECLAQARHRWEERWGLATLEVPQSRVCQLEAFYWFTAHLVANLARFREVYNAAVGEYRRVNHVRSTAHPVPDLAREGDWIEAPFWIWRKEDPHRRRLFVRRRGDEFLLADRAGVEIALPLADGGDGARAVQRLAELPGEGIKLRTRALATTLWARLVLGDLFLHGIGGAKYDQLTDLLIGRFFGLEPPKFLVLSATLQLPIPRRRFTPDEARDVDHRLRELTYHPERCLGAAAGGSAETEASPAGLVEEKARRVVEAPTRETARAFCQGIRQLNAAMQPWV
jgi:hypothetical protein